MSDLPECQMYDVIMSDLADAKEIFDVRCNDVWFIWGNDHAWHHTSSHL